MAASGDLEPKVLHIDRLVGDEKKEIILHHALKPAGAVLKNPHAPR
jgi:hypothetical protein